MKEFPKEIERISQIVGVDYTSDFYGFTGVISNVLSFIDNDFRLEDFINSSGRTYYIKLFSALDAIKCIRTQMNDVCNYIQKRIAEQTLSDIKSSFKCVIDEKARLIVPPRLGYCNSLNALCEEATREPFEMAPMEGCYDGVLFDLAYQNAHKDISFYNSVDYFTERLLECEKYVNRIHILILAHNYRYVHKTFIYQFIERLKSRYNLARMHSDKEMNKDEVPNWIMESVAETGIEDESKILVTLSKEKCSKQTQSVYYRGERIYQFEGRPSLCTHDNTSLFNVFQSGYIRPAFIRNALGSESTFSRADGCSIGPKQRYFHRIPSSRAHEREQLENATRINRENDIIHNAVRGPVVVVDIRTYSAFVHTDRTLPFLLDDYLIPFRLDKSYNDKRKEAQEYRSMCKIINSRLFKAAQKLEYCKDLDQIGRYRMSESEAIFFLIQRLGDICTERKKRTSSIIISQENTIENIAPIYLKQLAMDGLGTWSHSEQMNTMRFIPDGKKLKRRDLALIAILISCEANIWAEDGKSVEPITIAFREGDEDFTLKGNLCTYYFDDVFNLPPKTITNNKKYALKSFDHKLRRTLSRSNTTDKIEINEDSLKVMEDIVASIKKTSDHIRQNKEEKHY